MLAALIGVAAVLILTLLTAAGVIARHRNVHLWLPAYLCARRRLPKSPRGRMQHVIFCLADHFEPAVGDMLLGRQMLFTNCIASFLRYSLPNSRGSSAQICARRPRQ